ncbi:MAG: GerMN domain-containing protein [Candidatus Komeilibacteria bacterium]|nr:GerMN domain-containing protein [Candidatus Komeilibacteria bacterium]
MKKYLLICLLFLPLILSGCIFSKKNQEPVNEPNEQSYRSNDFENFYFSAKYPNGWELTENFNGLLGDTKNQVEFGLAEEVIAVTVVKAADRQKVLDEFKIESQTQTEVNGTLAMNLNGVLSANDQERFEAILAESGNYVIFLKTNRPGSQAFVDFKNRLSFPKLVLPSQQPKSAKVTLSLYFDKPDSTGQNFDCSAKAVKQVIVDRPETELGLIPVAIKLLLQLSNPEELEKSGLSSGLDLNTRLYSFGYENNKAIVNFDASLNAGGGSCLMTLRRSQIEKTLVALNEVSDLQIKQVEIQVDGDADTALQP